MAPNKCRKSRSHGHGDYPRSTQVPMLTALHWEPMTLHLITTHAWFKCYILSIKLCPWPCALRVTESSCWKADVADLVSMPMTLSLRLTLEIVINSSIITFSDSIEISSMWLCTYLYYGSKVDIYVFFIPIGKHQYEYWFYSAITVDHIIIYHCWKRSNMKGSDSIGWYA
jgi:hypothetical protein